MPPSSGANEQTSSSHDVAPAVHYLYAGLPNDCTVCKQIMHGFLTPFDQSYSAKLGDVSEIRSKACPAHDALLGHVRLDERWYPPEPATPETARPVSLRLEKEGQKPYVRITIVDMEQPNVRSYYHFALVNRSSVSSHPGRGYLPDPNWIDANRLLQWKEKCLHDHGSACEDLLGVYNLSESYPTWLIDVHQQCLIRGTRDARYVALSYVWGRVQIESLNASTETVLQQQGALADAQITLPETLRNVIKLVAQLGEQFVWIDALCISQDDEAMKFKELNKMAAIYAKAVFTIVVAEGKDANYGLPGLQGISNARRLAQKHFKFGETESVISPHISYHDLPNSWYFQRGWTFQEFVMSKRRLIFEEQIVRWECSRCIWSEDVVLSNETESHFRNFWMKDVIKGFPSLKTYRSAVHEFNVRDFTYNEDALAAFTGFLALLSQRYNGGFLCGIPEMCFEAGLNWYRETGDLTRRRSSSRSSADTPLSLLPSWSWVGWQGKVMGGCRVGENFWKRGAHHDSRCTIPITTWYTGRDPSGKDRRRIHPTFLIERQSYQDHHSREVPPGWTRHPWNPADSPTEPKYSDAAGNFENPPPDGCGTCFYTHEKIHELEFWYPVSIPAPKSEFQSQPQTPYLFCDTDRAWLHVTPDKTPYREFYMRMWLRDKMRRWIGVLHVHSKADLTELSVEQPLGPRIELVATSQGYMSSSFAADMEVCELMHDEFRRTSPLYDFYNVLWIEWHDGIAYRRGHGRVLREAWEKLREPQQVALTLG